MKSVIDPATFREKTIFKKIPHLRELPRFLKVKNLVLYVHLVQSDEIHRFPALNYTVFVKKIYVFNGK